MRILSIVKGTGADGPGLRNSIYVAGCGHHCPGCHNPESWDFTGGKDMSIDEILDEVLDDYTDVTISGGDPMYQAIELVELCKRLKKEGKNIWVYTGFTIDQLVGHAQRECLKYIDVLVDGPYIANKRDLMRFCGSCNQKIIYLKNGEITAII